MKVVLFGATGLVGQGVLRECLLDPDVEAILSVGRRGTGRSDPKLTEIAHQDFSDLSAIEDRLAGFDACLFCLGVSSAGMNEADYTRATHGFTLAAAVPLARLNPGITFVYVSGTGVDETGRGRVMWARVRGRTEADLFRLPFRAVYAVRPAVIQPLDGIRSRTRYIDWLYRAMTPVFPLIHALAPGSVTTTRELARAMLVLAKRGAPKRVIASADIKGLASTF